MCSSFLRNLNPRTQKTIVDCTSYMCDFGPILYTIWCQYKNLSVVKYLNNIFYYPFILVYDVLFFFYSFGPASVALLACSLLGFQCHNSGYEVTRLCPYLLRIMCYLVPPSLPPPRFPCIELHVYNQCARACISLRLLPPLR